MVEKVQAVLVTLEKVEVKGYDNLNRMLGCMQALESIANAMKHNREEMEKTPETVQKATQEGGEKNADL